MFRRLPSRRRRRRRRIPSSFLLTTLSARNQKGERPERIAPRTGRRSHRQPQVNWVSDDPNSETVPCWRVSRLLVIARHQPAPGRGRGLVRSFLLENHDVAKE